jgi:hypothetical protein
MSQEPAKGVKLGGAVGVVLSGVAPPTVAVGVDIAGADVEVPGRTGTVLPTAAEVVVRWAAPTVLEVCAALGLRGGDLVGLAHAVAARQPHNSNPKARCTAPVFIDEKAVRQVSSPINRESLTTRSR